jgi:signal transduction histidine kinase
MALTTGWRGGPCAVLLARMRPMPGEGWNRVLLFSGVFVVCFLVALAATTPTVWRVRRLAADARESADENYASIAPDNSKDEISALTFVFNEAAKEIHGRATGMTDRDDAMRRFVAMTAEHVAKPLAGLDAKIARGRLSAADHAAIARELNDLSAYLANLLAAARLRGRGEPVKRDEIDLAKALRRVADRLAPMAEAASVTLRIVPASTPVTLLGDAGLFDQAIGNLLHNAIRYNRQGGTVTATITRADNGRFQLRILDNGHGVTDEEMKGLTAIRRFRGDEGQDRRPGVPGLGLAVAREVIERAGLQMELERPSTPGFQVTIAG